MKAPACLPRLLSIVLVTATSSLCAAQTYTITDLGTLPGGGYSVARGVNATGEVTGASGNSNSNLSDVFLYSNGAMTNLGTLGGPSGIGNGINASGQIAGYSTNSAGTDKPLPARGGRLTAIGEPGGWAAGLCGKNKWR